MTVNSLSNQATTSRVQNERNKTFALNMPKAGFKRRQILQTHSQKNEDKLGTHSTHDGLSDDLYAEHCDRPSCDACRAIGLTNKETPLRRAFL
jgi:hypothetical protein